MAGVIYEQFIIKWVDTENPDYSEYLLEPQNNEDYQFTTEKSQAWHTNDLSTAEMVLECLRKSGGNGEVYEIESVFQEFNTKFPDEGEAFKEYEIVKHETEDYYYVWNLTDNEEECDENGEPYRFDTIGEAEEYIINIKGE